ncbi:MAG: hypothetical protein KBD01_03900 [Acidobacteria bacterium]|nr:hypothetical protein [Acidobacteriota bacterium]
MRVRAVRAIVPLFALVFSLAVSPAGAAGGARLALTLLDQAKLVILADTGALAGEFPTGPGPRGIAEQGGRLFVANRGLESDAGSTVSIIDPRVNPASREVKLCERCAPRALAFDRRGTLWMSAQAHQALYRIDPPYEQPSASVVVAWGWPTEIDVLPEADLVAVGFRGAPVMAFVDAIKMSASRVETGPVPETVAVRPGSGEVWAALNPSAQLVIVRGGKAERIAGPRYPLDIGFTPDGSRALVTSGGEPGLVLIDAATRKEVARVALGSMPRELAVSPDGSRVAVALPEAKKVAIVRLGERPAVEREVAVGGTVGGMIWIPDRQR